MLVEDVASELAKAKEKIEQMQPLLLKAASLIEALKHRVLRTNDNASAFPNDRTILLDADLVLSECYRMNLKEGR